MAGWLEEGRLGRPFRFSSTSRDLSAHCLRAVGLALLFLGWNAPNHYPPWTAFHLELFCALGVGLLSAASFAGPLLAKLAGQPPPSAGQPGQIVRLPLPLPARMWLLAALWPLLQWLAGGLAFRGDALIGLLYGLGVVMSLYVGQLWAAQQGASRVLRSLWLTVVVSALAANGLAIVQWLRLGAPGWWAMELIDHRPYANLAQPNHFGLLMVMAIVAVTALFEMRAVQRRWVHGMAVAFFGWGVLISQSRASVLALGALAVLWLLTRHRVPTRLRLVDLATGATLWLVLNLSVQPLQALLLLSPAAPLLSGANLPGEAEPRQWIWLHFWAAIEQRPWAGYGFNQGVMALAEVSGQVHPSRNTVFAHNLVLDLMIWFGIPLALAAFGALCAWMAGWLRKTDEPALSAQRHWVFAIWLALLLQSMLEFPFAHAYFLLPAALLAGAISPLPPAAALLHDGAVVRANRWMQALFAATALLFGTLVWEYFQLESDFRFNRFERANFSQRVSHQSLEAPWVLDQLAALNSGARIQIAPGMPAAQLDELRRLARRFHILSTRLEYAKALALNGRSTDAAKEMQIIQSIYPPRRFDQIDRDWRAWLKSNGLEELPSGPAVKP